MAYRTQKKWVLDNTVLIGYAVASGLLVTLFFLMAFSVRNYTRSADWRHHTLVVLDKLDDITIDLLEVRSSYRSYALNEGESKVENPVLLRQTNNDMASIKLLTRDNSEQQVNADSFLYLYKHTLTSLNLIVEKTDFHGMTLQKAKNYFLRVTLATNHLIQFESKLIEAERKLLKERENRERSSFLWVSWLGLIAVFLIFLFLVSIMINTIRQVKRNNGLNRALNEKNSELQRKNNQLEAARRDVEQFTYFISHDLKEPLRMVSSFTNLLLKKTPAAEPEIAEYKGYIQEGVTRMQQMVNDIMVFSKIGKTNQPKTETDLNQTLDKVLLYLSHNIEEKRAEIKKQSLPTVMAVASEMTELFQNLIGNALKFNRPGVKPIVKISCSQEGDYYIICITDNGIGIEPRDRERVFAIFQRLHTRQEYEGSGIGLAYCKKIVEQHGGKIWADSQPGEGSSFCFTLPIGSGNNS